MYVRDEEGSTPRPICELVGFKRIHLKKGARQKVEFTIQPRELAMINKDDKFVIEPGWFSISVGGSQPNFTENKHINSTNTVIGRVEIKGKTTELEF